jgi:hypothetical protein
VASHADIGISTAFAFFWAIVAILPKAGLSTLHARATSRGFILGCNGYSGPLDAKLDLIGMQRNAIALAVEDNSAKTKGADLMFRLQHFAAI